MGEAKTIFGDDIRNDAGVSGRNTFSGGGLALAGLPAGETSMNRVKGNVTFKSPARMRGNSRIGGEPDGKGVVVDQGADPGQHIGKQKQHGNELLCGPAPERQYVPGVGQGHNHVILMNSRTPGRIPALHIRVWHRVETSGPVRRPPV